MVYGNLNKSVKHVYLLVVKVPLIPCFTIIVINCTSLTGRSTAHEQL